MKKVKLYWKLYYPVFLAFIPFGMALELAEINRQTSLIVGLLTPSILALFILVRQRRNDYNRAIAASKRRRNYSRRKPNLKKNKK